MAAGDPDDVLRSLRRYVWWMLGADAWEVRTQRTRVDDDARPVAVIEEAAPTSVPFARRSVPQGDRQLAQSFTVVCYPVLGTTPNAARAEAGRVRTLLDRGLASGLVTDDVPPAVIGGPYAFPVWDWEGVPVEGAGRDAVGAQYAVALIDQTVNVRPIQDPQDELRFTVVANLRCSWWAPGRVRVGPRVTVAGMPGTHSVQ